MERIGLGAIAVASFSMQVVLDVHGDAYTTGGHLVRGAELKF